MTITKIDKVVTEAKRFLHKAAEAKVRIKAEGKGEFEDYFWIATKETAAMKRASMDLTRALTELRKS